VSLSKMEKRYFTERGLSTEKIRNEPDYDQETNDHVSRYLEKAKGMENKEKVKLKI